MRTRLCDVFCISLGFVTSHELVNFEKEIPNNLCKEKLICTMYTEKSLTAQSIDATETNKMTLIFKDKKHLNHILNTFKEIQ